MRRADTEAHREDKIKYREAIAIFHRNWNSVYPNKQDSTINENPNAGDTTSHGRNSKNKKVKTLKRERNNNIKQPKGNDQNTSKRSTAVCGNTAR